MYRNVFEKEFRLYFMLIIRWVSASSGFNNQNNIPALENLVSGEFLCGYFSSMKMIFLCFEWDAFACIYNLHIPVASKGMCGFIIFSNLLRLHLKGWVCWNQNVKKTNFEIKILIIGFNINARAPRPIFWWLNIV